MFTTIYRVQEVGNDIETNNMTVCPDREGKVPCLQAHSLQWVWNREPLFAYKIQKWVLQEAFSETGLWVSL